MLILKLCQQGRTRIGKISYKEIITFQTIIYHLFDLNADWDEVVMRVMLHSF